METVSSEKVAVAARKILLCHGTGCTSTRSPKVMAELQARLEAEQLGSRVQLSLTGCHGFCQNGPITIVQPEGVFYTRVKPEDVPEIVESHLKNNRVVERLLYRDPATGEPVTYHDQVTFYRKQQRIVLRHCGLINPEDIDDYLGVGGYTALRKVLFDLTPDGVIAEIKRSGLRGRGGAGFSTGMKWEFCRKAPGTQKYMVCNADEGDPGAFMDRSVLEADPHAVIEGLVIAAYAIGASEGYAYIRAEYPLAVKRMRIAIRQAEERGYLGKNILGSRFQFHLHVKEGAGAFVCGEETALLASIEGRRGMPRPRPPFPAQSGLWGKPTTINNVETLANVAAIIERGADWYASFGTEKSKGTKVFALTGKVRNTGLVEVPMGMTLREVVFDIGGGIIGDRAFKAAQTGGPSGGCLPAKLLDLPLDYESLAQAGSIVGSGGLVVMDETTCMVDLARFFLSFTQAESCGKCVPCRTGTKHMLDILVGITQGRGRPEDIALLQELAQTVNAGSLCGLGQTAPNAVLGTLRYFREEYEEHVKYQRCRAGVCKVLAESKCRNACPAGIDIPRHIRRLLEGDYTGALAVIRERNPFPGVCGRVCPHPCEARCRRGEIDQPVAIRALRRFIADYVEGNLEWHEEPPAERRAERVAVIGGGPSGLSCAYYLAKIGYPVTVLEAMPEAGGAMMYGIPDYRLDKNVLRREIKLIEELGVEIKTNSVVGRDYTLDGLNDQGFQAIYISPGAQVGQRMRVPGEDQAGVVEAVNFLRRVNLGAPVSIGARVAVVGGGNTAMDAARTAVRLGAKKVHLVYRRLKEHMTAHADEVREAEEEGIAMHFLAAPLAVLGDGQVTGLRCQRMRLGARDESGRPRPEPIAGDEFVLDVDTVIAAIGQGIDLAFVPEELGLATARGGVVSADPYTMATSVPGVFAGGDAVLGPATVIEAIAQGEKAAASIDRYLRGTPLEPVLLHARGAKKMESPPPTLEEAGSIARHRVPVLPPDERIRGFAEVELGITIEEALEEAKRCLHCDLED